MLSFHYPGNWSGSSYTGVFYIHTQPLANDPTTLKPIGTINTCREYFVKSYRTKICGTKDHRAISIRKANVLISFGRPLQANFGSYIAFLKESAEKSVFIINSFEKEHKWPLTKVYPVKSGDSIPFVFFSGPRKWTTSPYLMSIWALCVRLGRNKWLPKNLLTLDHEALVRQLAIVAKTGGSEDANQLFRTIREWDPFMTLYPDLFGDNTRKYHWLTKHLNGCNDRPEGIQKLINGSTGYKELHKKYFELKEAKKLK